MAKVIGPLHSTEARGVIGGLIYNTWRGIRTVKRMTSPAQPRTKAVLDVRAWAMKLVRQWQTLTAPARADWNDYADDHTLIDWTGVAKRITGANWFVGLNTRLLSLGKVVVLIPPTTPAPNPVANLTATPGAAKVTFTWTDPTGSDKTLVLYKHGPHSPGLQSKIEKARYCAGVSAETATYDYPVTQIGLYSFWACICDEDNGLISTWVTITATVTTLV